MATPVETLIDKFGAESVGGSLIARVDGVVKQVARRVDGDWHLTSAGKDLLSTPDAPKKRRGRRPAVEQPVDAFVAGN